MKKTARVPEVGLPVPDRRPEMSLTIPSDDKSFAKKLAQIKMGATVTFEVTGKVTSMNMEEGLSSSIRLLVKDIECYPSMGAQITAYKDSRKE